MSELKIFEHGEFGSVRVVVREGKPWFVAKDVAEALGYKDTPSAITDHCKHAETLKVGKTPPFDNCPELQAMHPQTKIINQADVLRLVVHSKLPAAEKVELWLFDEVGASVMEHGVYATPLTLEKMIADPAHAIGLLTALQKEQEARKLAEGTTVALREQMKKDEPMRIVGEHITGAENDLYIAEVAKILKRSHGVKITQKGFFSWLIHEKYIYRKLDYYLPYAIKEQQGLLKTSADPVPTGHGGFWNRPVVKITAKGMAHFILKFSEMTPQGLADLLTRIK